MNRVDRLTGIIIALQGGPRTAQQLADRFEVSRRTILRDIDAISQLHVPIIAIPGPNGGYELPADYSLPPIRFTSDEVTLLLLALSNLGLTGSAPMGAAFQSAQEKVLAVLNHDVRTQAMANLRHFTVQADTEKIDQTLVDQLRSTAAATQWVRLTYVRNETTQVRTVLPQQVYLASDRWYVRTIDLDRMARRIYRVSRIRELQPVPTPPNADEAIRQASQADGQYHHPDHPEIDVRLTPRGLEFATDHPDLRHHIAGDRLTFRCPESELAFYAREFIRYGTEVTVLAPPALKSMMIERLSAMLEHHEKQ
jgi:predicted DNA-binding transcriptional regulator YafY